MTTGERLVRYLRVPHVDRLVPNCRVTRLARLVRVHRVPRVDRLASMVRLASVGMARLIREGDLSRMARSHSCGCLVMSSSFSERG